MAILAHDEILKQIEQGIIKIEPFDPKRVGPASIDCTLGTTFRRFKNLHEAIDLTSDEFDADKFSEEIAVTDGITLQSGQAILGVTQEKITLPPTICGWIQGRSRFARLGLMVHIASSFIQPGVSNHQVLELFNAGPMAITIHPTVAVCQIIFEETVGSGVYSGKFQGQMKP